MTLRSGHGTGAGAPRIEVLAPDELPAASPSLAVRSERDALGRFVRGNTVQRAKLARPGLRGHTSALAVDPAFAPYERWGRRYAAHRRAELARAHGGELSAGVAALIESAGAQLAASRFVHAKASTSGDVSGFKQSSTLANDARQNELAAWELAAREAKARPRKLMPWLSADEDDEDVETETSAAQTDPPAAVPSASATTPLPVANVTTALPVLPIEHLELPKGGAF